MVAEPMIRDMSTRPTLTLGQPRGEAAHALAALLATRAELEERLDALDREQRAATKRRDAASGALADLERKMILGSVVTDAQRTDAEDALARAKAENAAPWLERRAGVLAAIRDHDRELQTFVADHLDELLAEQAEDGEAAAEAVDRACQALVAAFRERQAVEQRVVGIAAMIRIPRVEDVARTRAEAVVAEANRLLDAGGEAAPLLRVDPRAPREGEPDGQ